MGGKGFEEAYTMKPVAAKLSELLGKPVAFAEDCLKAQAQVDALKDGEVLLLENLRFYPGEGAKKEEDRLEMATVLAGYCDLYVSDAFGTAHRDAASMTGVPKIKGFGACGYLLQKEIDYFAKALTNPATPVVAIVGGAKVSDKILLLKNMMDKCNKMVIGGAMAYTFLRAQGKSTGSSKCETEADDPKKGKVDIVKLAAELLELSKTKGVEVYLPLDHACNTTFAATDSPTITTDDNVPEGLMALDIGPKTIAKYCEIVGSCKTAIWNGPMGVFELPGFEKGTFSVAKTLADTPGLLSIVGGGDSASAAEKAGVADKLSHISTGGGASLELLEGKVLPGLNILTDK
eukprot:NODE_741_length_1209_cov_388.725862_g595_i0.p2 GENE.NODE_741_length_1209_cov_388.725862_g595_i0~~NODE_741_length_1209_cov_388.725862_g595_i0.p2  ORF type:complete len:356 (+),score=182.62 NODE_741_length_1209_cov_388.725862_g595_i0:30-1070(+)